MQDISEHFGSQCVSFLNAKAFIMDLTTFDRLMYPYSLDMSSGERHFIRGAIDNLKPEAVRDGGRIAYLAVFGSKSWEADERVLIALALGGSFL